MQRFSGCGSAKHSSWEIDDLQAARRVATWLWSWMDSSFNKMSVKVTWRELRANGSVGRNKFPLGQYLALAQPRHLVVLGPFGL